MKIKRIKFREAVLFPGKSQIGTTMNKRNEFNGGVSQFKDHTVTLEKGVFVISSASGEVRVPHGNAVWYVVDNSK